MKLRYLLDTNIVSYFLGGRWPLVQQKIAASGLELCSVSAVTEAEIRFGLERKPGAIRQRIAIDLLFHRLVSLPWDSRAAVAYARLRAHQERIGKSLSTEDTMIAAHALALDLILITHDTAFENVEALRREDWTQA